MKALDSVTITRFKGLQSITIPLSDLNILIGSNNSGKSSVLQAIHLAVAVAQSAKLVGNVNWAQDRYQLSINASQLLYCPTSDAMTIATGGTLTESANSRVEILLKDADAQVCTIGLRRGRNRNIALSIEGKTLGEKLQDLVNPFTIYVPGLAGVPREETQLSMGLVRKIVARGDANLVLRNILLLLRKKNAEWWKFLSYMRSVFPGIFMTVNFDADTDEFIDVRYRMGGGAALPIDMAGTGVLQAAQLLGYVFLFNPKILILDEPDSHLHPNNQKALCALLDKMAKELGIQIILSTHSRHMLDSMKKFGAQINWLAKGEKVQVPEGDMVQQLMDLGALDSVDYFANGQIKWLVATEDSDPEPLKTLLWANGFDEEETEVVSYNGCTKIESALILGQFLTDRAPSIKLVVHKDRDYESDEEISAFAQRLQAIGVEAFVTEGSDIESHFLLSKHLVALNPQLDIRATEQLVVQSIAESRTKSIEQIVNLRTMQAFRKRNKNGGGQPNHGEIATQAAADFDKDPVKMVRGDVALGIVKAKIQEALGTNPRILGPTEHLRIKSLSSLISD